MAADSYQIDPQAQEILDAAASKRSLTDIEDPVEYVAAKRSGFSAQASNAIWAGGAAEPVETVEELTVETPSGAIPARLYRGALKEAGVPVTRTRYPGMIHGFLGMLGRVVAARRLVDQIAGAVDSAC